MNVAYIRVSTEEQNTARQEEAIKRFDVERIFLEKISGKNTDRPQLKAMLDYVREGDTLIVESYSRLARNTSDLVDKGECRYIHPAGKAHAHHIRWPCPIRKGMHP